MSAVKIHLEPKYAKLHSSFESGGGGPDTGHGTTPKQKNPNTEVLKF